LDRSGSLNDPVPATALRRSDSGVAGDRRLRMDEFPQCPPRSRDERSARIRAAGRRGSRVVRRRSH